MRYTKPQFFYHISREPYWGEKIKLEPQVRNVFLDSEEPKVPRICVAPTAPQCLVAIAVTPRDRYFVYRTYRKIRGSYPFNVADVRITRERWLRSPATFIRVCEISSKTISILSKYDSGYRGSTEQLYLQKKDLIRIREYMNNDGTTIKSPH